MPSLYDVAYNKDGTIAETRPKKNAPPKIKKRLMLDMDRAYYPDRFVMPYIEIVHNRAVEEVFRGCIRGCRFCQAGFLYRPVREKSIDVIDRQCHALCDHTGYDEVSLSSLSTSDYSDINGLLDKLLLWADEEKVSISLPSQRVDAFSTEMMNKIKSVRKSGLTFAPEAGTQRLRDVINKNVTEEELMKTVNICLLYTSYNEMICADPNPLKYDMVIGNPPYMKIAKDAPEAKAMPDICYGAPNLYFLFAAMGMFNLIPNGELVYIIPRSWTSGAYFKRFRQKFLNDGVLEHIHLFVSRDKVFENESVLQETIIIKMRKSTATPARDVYKRQPVA